jgi:UPF0716 protein FxsA
VTRVVLALIFIVVPFIELYVLLQVGQAIGVLNTIGLLVVVSVVGAWLVKREGIGVLQRAQVTMAEGRVPAAELLDGVLILFAGALLITPGFLSDVLGVLLLLPPVRVAVRGTLRRYLARRVQLYRLDGR